MTILLAAIDFSTSTEAVLEQASRLAKAFKAKLWVLHVANDETQAIVYENSPYSDLMPDFNSMPGDVKLARDLSAEELKREHSQLLNISATLKEDGIAAQAVLIKGHAAQGIIDKAKDIEANIILMGSHGHGLLHKALLGSVSESVIRNAPCNVLIVPAPAS